MVHRQMDNDIILVHDENGETEIIGLLDLRTNSCLYRSWIGARNSLICAHFNIVSSLYVHAIRVVD